MFFCEQIVWRRLWSKPGQDRGSNEVHLHRHCDNCRRDDNSGVREGPQTTLHNYLYRRQCAQTEDSMFHWYVINTHPTLLYQKYNQSKTWWWKCWWCRFSLPCLDDIKKVRMNCIACVVWGLEGVVFVSVVITAILQTYCKLCEFSNKSNVQITQRNIF